MSKQNFNLKAFWFYNYNYISPLNLKIVSENTQIKGRQCPQPNRQNKRLLKIYLQGRSQYNSNGQHQQQYQNNDKWYSGNTTQRKNNYDQRYQTNQQYSPYNQNQQSQSQWRSNRYENQQNSSNWRQNRYNQGYQSRNNQDYMNENNRGSNSNYKPQEFNDDDIPLETKQAMLIETFKNHKIYLSQHTDGQYNNLDCPFCEGGSKKEKSFSVKIQDQGTKAVYNCFRKNKCGQQGVFFYNGRSGSKVNVSQEYIIPEKELKKALTKAENSPELQNFFKERGISLNTLQRYDVRIHKTNFKTEIAFPYQKFGEYVNYKFRDIKDKKFRQVTGSQPLFYGFQQAYNTIGDFQNKSDRFLIIVEGEIDVLSFAEVGFENVVSVPSGATTGKVIQDQKIFGSSQFQAKDAMAQYLENSNDLKSQFDQFVIATDNDEAGQNLSQELQRRMGVKLRQISILSWPNNYEDSYQCYQDMQKAFQQEQQLDIQQTRDHLESSYQASYSKNQYNRGEIQAQDNNVAYKQNGLHTQNDAQSQVSNNDNSLGQYNQEDQEKQGQNTEKQKFRKDEYYRKDANEVLVKDGKEALKWHILNKTHRAVYGGLSTHDEYGHELYRMFMNPSEFKKYSYFCGWDFLHPYYKIVPGELTIVTGIPGSGKSEFIDNVIQNLAELHDLRFCICSFEKNQYDIAIQYIERRLKKKKPSSDLDQYDPKYIQMDEFLEADKWFGEHFVFIKKGEEQLSIDAILQEAERAVEDFGIQGLVIDPYNEIEHYNQGKITETMYVSQILSKVKSFAQRYMVHVWFVAHPRQMQDWKGSHPSLYDISGSANWNNKADVGIVIHRKIRDTFNNPNKVQDMNLLNTTQVRIEKVRNRYSGSIGTVLFEYDTTFGTYNDKHDNVITQNETFKEKGYVR